MAWILLVLLAALFRGMSDTLKKRATTDNVLDSIGALAITGFILSLPVLFFDVQFSFSFSLLIILIVFAALNVIAMFFLMASYKSEEVSTVIPLYNLSPAFLLILSFLILGEKPLLLQIIGVGVIIVGGYFLTVKNAKNWHHPFTEISFRHLFFMFMVLIIASFLAIFNKFLLQSLSVFTVYFWFIVFYTILVLGLLVYKKRFVPVMGMLKRKIGDFTYPSVFMVLTSLVFFYVLSDPEVLVSLAIPVLRVSTIITIILGGRMFHEHNIVHKIAAAVIMLAGVFIIAVA